MHHLHFKSIDSTQNYLRDHFEELKKHSQDILISASNQTVGIGRRGHHWDSYANSIAMSFTLTPNTTPSLTPIEIGLMTINFFNSEFGTKLFIKWPNDILTLNYKKCGGIISQYIDEKNVIAGLGLNLGNIENMTEPADYKHGLGVARSDLVLNADDQKSVSLQLYQYYLAHRINDFNELKTLFDKYCPHLNSQVAIEDESVYTEGIFRGISKNGEALIEIDKKNHAFLSSSLKILS